MALPIDFSCPISGLSDECLAEIFKRLPPYDRLIVSEVCRRWHGLSRMAWLDVVRLDLSSIRGQPILAIIQLCPNVQAVFAKEASFGPGALRGLPKAAQLTSVKLYQCRFAVDQPLLTSDNTSYLFWQIFPFLGLDVDVVAWNELVLHNACVAGADPFAWMINGAILPSTLTRLQLTGLCGESDAVKFNAFIQLENLECLILEEWPEHQQFHNLGGGNDLYDIRTMQNLRELWLSPAPTSTRHPHLDDFVADMPKLEVLFLNELSSASVAYLSNVITQRSSLRILVLSGGVATEEPLEVPARTHAPKLSIFLGKTAAEKIHCEHSAFASVYPITEPMPDFIQRAEIAPIFEGVWIAEMIRESAQNGGGLWSDEARQDAHVAAANQ